MAAQPDAASPPAPGTASVEASAAAGAPATPRAARLPLGTILNYNLPALGAGYMFLLIGLYLMKFATDVLLIAPAFMGTVFGLSRIWDAISDPVAGYLSDRTHTRMGRRRPWIALSALPIGAGFIMAFAPPAWLEGAWLNAWMAVGVVGFYSAMTIFVVPHMSLGAELTDDYHDRSRIFGIRHAMWTVGSMLALAGMYYLITAEASGAEASRAAAQRQSWFAAVFTGVLVLWAALRLRERPEFQGRGGTNPMHAFRDVWANPHARLLLIVTLVENLGAATIGILTLYIAEYIFKIPGQAPLVILSYMIPSFASVPLWVPLSRRFGKKRMWMFSMLLTAFSFGAMFLLDETMVPQWYVLAVLAGLAAGCGGTVGPSIQTDVIDYDEYTTGERKEGAYFAAWNFVFKASFGVTLMLTGYVLSWSGFVPKAEQTDTVKFALRSLYAIYPLVCYVAGTLIFARFSLGEREHAEIRLELDRRRAAAHASGAAGESRPSGAS